MYPERPGRLHPEPQLVPKRVRPGTTKLKKDVRKPVVQTLPCSHGLSLTVATMIQLMEPIMIVVLGFIVGFIVIALYLPIFTLGDAISE